MEPVGKVMDAQQEIQAMLSAQGATLVLLEACSDFRFGIPSIAE